MDGPTHEAIIKTLTEITKIKGKAEVISMNKIAFEKVIREAKLLSPLLGFKLAVHSIEFRKDLLTGRGCRINIERTKRVKQVKARGDN